MICYLYDLLLFTTKVHYNQEKLHTITQYHVQHVPVLTSTISLIFFCSVSCIVAYVFHQFYTIFALPSVIQQIIISIEYTICEKVRYKYYIVKNTMEYYRIHNMRKSFLKSNYVNWKNDFMLCALD